MKIFRRILLAVIVLLVIGLAAGWVFIHHLKTRAIPDYSASVDLERLTDEVTVFRDSWHLRHGVAESSDHGTRFSLGMPPKVLNET